MIIEMMFEKESIGSNSSVTSPPPLSGLCPTNTGDGYTAGNAKPPPQQNQRLFALKGDCFHCRKPGHWMKDCPDKQPSLSPNSSVTSPPPLSGLCPTNTGDGYTAGNANPPPLQNQRLFALKGDCFHCRKPGHWMKDCPDKQPSLSPKRPQPQVSIDHRNVFRNVLCSCGTYCVERVSTTLENPGRKFYVCPNKSATSKLFLGKKCKFKWCDEMEEDDFVYAPMCPCEAGPCRIHVETSGRDAGRKFFVCAIKKGQGACNFIRPLDAAKNYFDESTCSPKSTLTQCYSSPTNSDLFEEGDFSHLGMEIESSKVDRPEQPQKLEESSGLAREDSVPLVDFSAQEDTSDEPVRRHYKRLRHGVPKLDNFILDSASDSVLTLDTLILQRQPECWRQISSAGASLTVVSSTSSDCNSSALSASRIPLTENILDTAYEILGFNIKGWSGRLVYAPSCCLTFPAPTPFFCCVFPSFDPISVPRDVDVYDVEASTVVMHGPSPPESDNPSLLTPCQPSGARLWEPSGLESSIISQADIMRDHILEAFEQTAVRLQDRLFTHLESMDFRDHESMAREAGSVFGALKTLFFYCQPLKGLVTIFIDSAASLAKAEHSLHTERSSQELVASSYKRQKLHCVNLHCAHAETTAALEASDVQLQNLREESLRLREALSRVDKELSACEVENVEILTRLEKIAEEMLESDSSVQVAAEAAEAAKQLFQQKEAERNDAKASFDNARSILRQN